LAVLDENFPNHGETLLNELAALGVTLVHMGPGGDMLAGWRFRFSQGPMLADAWTTLESMVRRTAATTTASWAEVQRVGAEIQAEARGTGNQIVENMIGGLLRSHRASREGLAHLRVLLRGARRPMSGNPMDVPGSRTRCDRCSRACSCVEHQVHGVPGYRALRREMVDDRHDLRPFRFVDTAQTSAVEQLTADEATQSGCPAEERRRLATRRKMRHGRPRERR
jgi:hypothetical protein